MLSGNGIVVQHKRECQQGVSSILSGQQRYTNHLLTYSIPHFLQARDEVTRRGRT